MLKYFRGTREQVPPWEGLITDRYLVKSLVNRTCSLFTLKVIGRQCSEIVAVPGYLRY